MIFVLIFNLVFGVNSAQCEGPKRRKTIVSEAAFHRNRKLVYDLLDLQSNLLAHASDSTALSIRFIELEKRAREATAPVQTLFNHLLLQLKRLDDPSWYEFVIERWIGQPNLAERESLIRWGIEALYDGSYKPYAVKERFTGEFSLEVLRNLFILLPHELLKFDSKLYDLVEGGGPRKSAETLVTAIRDEVMLLRSRAETLTLDPEFAPRRLADIAAEVVDDRILAAFALAESILQERNRGKRFDAVLQEMLDQQFRRGRIVRNHPLHLRYLEGVEILPPRLRYGKCATLFHF